MFTGTYTAIVTPFKNGQLDEAALAQLIKGQIKGGVDGIVPVGTTGESPTVDTDEHIRIIELSVKLAAGKIKVLAGTGANSTSEAIVLTKAAEGVGADGSLQVAPYYNKPTPEGLYQHFKAIANNTKLPIVLYRAFPDAACVLKSACPPVKRLAADCKNIVGIKEAGGNADRVLPKLRAALGNKSSRFCLGDDSLTLPLHGRSVRKASSACRVQRRAARSFPRWFAPCRWRYTKKALADSPETVSAVQRFVHRDQSRSGQSRALDPWPDGRRISPAARAHERRQPRHAQGRDESSGSFEVTNRYELHEFSQTNLVVLISVIRVKVL